MSSNSANGHADGQNGHTTVIKTSNEPLEVLKALGLTDKLNEGLVSDTQVKAKGEVIDTYCPSTGKILGQIQTVCLHLILYFIPNPYTAMFPRSTPRQYQTLSTPPMKLIASGEMYLLPREVKYYVRSEMNSTRRRES